MIAAVRRFARRLQAFLRPDQAEAELAREITAHLALAEEQFRLQGLSPEAAARAARRAVGRTDSIKTMQRDARSFLWLEDARRDTHYAIRTLAGHPGFTLLAVLTLALGIGAVTVVYSVVHNVLLAPLPYPGSDRLVNVVVEDTTTGQTRTLLVPEFLDLRDHADAFEDVVATRAQGMVLTIPGQAEPVRAVRVSPNFFPFMGLPPQLGRALSPDDSIPGASPVAVLRHRAWVGIFGADPTVVGRTIQLDGTAYTIVGVMPPRFTWHAADVWIPGALESSAPPARVSFQARLKPDATVARVETQLTTIATHRAREFPREYPDQFRVRVRSAIDNVVRDFRGVLYTLTAAVALLMLIACCNVANMLLARATAREREMTVRAAIGAGQSRIVRQLLVESLLLAVVGGIVGCVIAYGGVALIVPYVPEGPLPGEVVIALNGPALLVALATAVTSALAFGITPAVFSARRNLVDGLRGAGKGVGLERGRVRHALVVAEIALSLALLFSAGLLMRNFLSLARVDLGFDVRNTVAAIPVFLPGSYETMPERRRLYREWIERIAATPGIEGVGTTVGLPPFGGNWSEVTVPGADRGTPVRVLMQWSTDGYFQAIGARLRTGRLLTADDGGDQPRYVAVVNSAFERTYGTGGSVLGQAIGVVLSSPGATSASADASNVVRTMFEVVGVIDDVRNRGIKEPAAPEVYLPGFSPGRPPVVIARATGAMPATLAAVRESLRAIDPQVGLYERAIEDELEYTSYAQPRFSLLVLGTFAVAGGLLVAIGIYSVMAYTVSRQTRDIAVRLALGARRADVCALILRRSAVLATVGIVVGLLASIGVGRIIAAQLWNIPPYDPVTLTVTIALVLAVALLATLIPARRAMRIEPMVALRGD